MEFNTTGSLHANVAHFTNSIGVPDIFLTRTFADEFHAVNTEGGYLPGWPILAEADELWESSAAGDLNGDGFDEVINRGLNSLLTAFSRLGLPLNGWPVNSTSEYVHQCGGGSTYPAIGDINGDGRDEVVMATISFSGINGCVFALDMYGSILPGFPKPAAGFDPVLSDIDGDGDFEILVIVRNSGSSQRIDIIDGTGILVRSIPGPVLADYPDYFTQIVPADITGDGQIEIVGTNDVHVSIIDLEGRALPGWPRRFVGGAPAFSAGAIVADIDGDGQQDIIADSILDRFGARREWVTLHRNPDDESSGRVFGSIVQVADIDLDGRNEIVIDANTWDGIPGVLPQLYVLDLGGPTHGPVTAGMHRGDAKRTLSFSKPLALGSAADLSIEIIGPAGYVDAGQVHMARLLIASSTESSATVVPEFSVATEFGPSECCTPHQVDTVNYQLVSISGATCEVRHFKRFCSTPALAPGQQAEVTLEFRALIRSRFTTRFSLGHRGTETDVFDNLGMMVLDVKSAPVEPEPDPELPEEEAGGGGGGAFGLECLLACATLLGMSLPRRPLRRARRGAGVSPSG